MKCFRWSEEGGFPLSISLSTVTHSFYHPVCANCNLKEYILCYISIITHNSNNYFNNKSYKKHGWKEPSFLVGMSLMGPAVQNFAIRKHQHWPGLSIETSHIHKYLTWEKGELFKKNNIEVMNYGINNYLKAYFQHQGVIFVVGWHDN